MVALVATAATGCSSASFCKTTGSGATAADAAAMFVARCGSDYAISRGPLDGEKAATPFATYADVVEFNISVRNNDEGSLGFLEVGRKTVRSPWRTLAPLGTGP